MYTPNKRAPPHSSPRSDPPWPESSHVLGIRTRPSTGRNHWDSWQTTLGCTLGQNGLGVYTGNGLGVYTGNGLGVYTGISHYDQWQRSQCTPSGQPQCTPSGQPQCAPPTAGPHCTPPMYTRSISQACSISDPNAMLGPRFAASMCTRWRTAPCVHQPQCAPAQTRPDVHPHTTSPNVQ